MAGPVTLRGERVVLREATEADVPRIVEILTIPEVAQWWPRETEDGMRAQLTEDQMTTWTILDGDDVVGVVQAWEETEPDYRHAGIDLALHPDWHGRGLGTDTVRTVARHLFADRGHHRATIDPAAHNERAIRTYERVGFRPVGVMRRYERGADGTWHDGLLMDMLPEDLR
ncbi:MAG: aminoglycoside 6-N-acetyltransferase [Solirubrobacteraceae bacterium]|jgi:aminoglycoside 6'-N-acetyltransferase|nr:aminoglycoside 6-N-acetyltransferase [Solirubrobacteraceae bacterium]